MLNREARNSPRLDPQDKFALLVGHHGRVPHVSRWPTLAKHHCGVRHRLAAWRNDCPLDAGAALELEDLRAVPERGPGLECLRPVGLSVLKIEMVIGRQA